MYWVLWSYLAVSFHLILSDSVCVDILCEALPKIGDRCKWEVAWSAVIDINGVSGSDNTELGVSSLSGGYRGLWFIDEAKPGKGISKSVDIKEIFKMFL